MGLASTPKFHDTASFLIKFREEENGQSCLFPKGKQEYKYQKNLNKSYSSGSLQQGILPSMTSCANLSTAESVIPRDAVFVMTPADSGDVTSAVYAGELLAPVQLFQERNQGSSL